MTPEATEVTEWLQKAYLDLRSARVLLTHEPPVVETACFHCQQAVEKGLKAYLVWRGVAFDRVHSLSYLLDMCEEMAPELASLRERIEALTPYAVEVRYPGATGEISLEDGQESLMTAEMIWEVILDLIPAQSRLGV
jgi:HEPN domain-containing protein